MRKPKIPRLRRVIKTCAYCQGRIEYFDRGWKKATTEHYVQTHRGYDCCIPCFEKLQAQSQ